MKSTTSPYDTFEGFYPLEDVIDAYMEIWYKDDSDSSSSWVIIITPLYKYNPYSSLNIHRGYIGL